MIQTKAIPKKKELEMILSTVKPHSNPKLFLEQYSTPSQTATNLLYMAAFTFGDIIGKTVCDLGCGTGILAIGAAYLGAKHVIGVDIDASTLLMAKRNAEAVKVDPMWVIGDIDILKGNFDTVVENPPFGVRKHGADLKFLYKALHLASTVYSIHKNNTYNRRFIGKFVEKNQGSVTEVIETELTIPSQFSFHKKPRYRVKVDLYRIARRNRR